MTLNPQGFPIDNTLVDSNGSLTNAWLHFFVSLWKRTGAGNGNDSASFNYPKSHGDPGQVLTSEGPANASIWTTLLTKLSQFTNDIGFITSDALVGLATTTQTDSAISASFDSHASNAIPLMDSATGSPGRSGSFARSDHVHPRERSPVFSGDVMAAKFLTGGATWTAGSGGPINGSEPNGSLYSNTAATQLGQRLYVSDGTNWNAVSGV